MIRLTVEETNLLSIYNEGGKRALIENVNAALPYMDADMRELAKRICAAASEEIPWTDTDPRDRVSSGHDRFPDHGLYFLLSGTV